MRIAVEATCAAGPPIVAALRRQLTGEPVLAWRDSLGLRVAASPAWLDEGETESLRRLGVALQKIADGGMRAIATRPELRRRLRFGPRAVLSAARSDGLDAALFAATWPAWFRAFCSPSGVGPLTLRADGFITEQGFQLFEVNAGPTVWSMHDDLCRVPEAAPELASLFDGLVPARAVSGLVDALLERHRARFGTAEPRVAIVDDPRYRYVDIWRVAEELSQRAIPVELCRIEDLDIFGQQLLLRGRPVHILYDEGQLAAARSPLQRLRHACVRRRAHRAGIAQVYPLPVYGALHKGFVALLSEGALESAVAPEALEAALPHIPWTRITEPGKTRLFDASTADLREAVLGSQDDLVLKPALATCGTGVVFGDGVTSLEWQRAVRRAFSARDHVVQLRLRPPLHDLVLLDPPGERLKAYVDTNPIYVDGRLVAVLQRYSDAPVTNFCATRPRNAYGFIPTWTARE